MVSLTAKINPKTKGKTISAARSMAISETSTDSSSSSGVVSERAISFSDVWRSTYRQSPGCLSAFAVRVCASIGARLLVEIEGSENLRPENDPFIVVLNHSQKLEALYLPGVLMHLREGKVIHFLADWNFCLVPGVWFFYHFGQAIPIARKPAKPRFLNAFKPLFVSREPGLSRARRALEARRSIGIFPEGTTNRDPKTLLQGNRGAAQLSMQTQSPILPIGVCFPFHNSASPIPECIPMSLRVGKLIFPPPVKGKPNLREICGWHRQIMETVASLSGKSWQAHSRRK